MNKKRNIMLVGIFLLLVLCITLGYALLTQVLTINGITKINKTSWIIYWDNAIEREGSVPSTQDLTIDSTKTLVTFGTTLSKPGDYYEFQVDTVNDGSIDAMVTKITKVGVAEEYQKYISFTATYLDGSKIKVYDKLKANTRETIKLRVEFNDVNSADDLPNTEIDLDLSFEIEYGQDDGTESEEEVAMMMEYDSNQKFFQDDFRRKVTNIYLNNQINILSNAVETWDISVDQDEKVVAFYVLNEDDNTKYDLYIQGDGALYTNPNAYRTFYNFSLNNISGFEKLNTKYSTNMNEMFKYFGLKTDLDLTNFDVKNVISAHEMFYGFGGSDNRTELNLSNWNLEEATDFSRMFSSVYNRNINIDNWNTPKAENMEGMFFWSGFTELDLTSLDTGNVTNMKEIFLYSSNLKTVNVTGLDTSSLIDFSKAFEGCENLSSIVGIDNWDMSSVENMERTFFSLRNLKSLDTSNWNLGSVINLKETFYQWELESLDTSNWGLESVESMNSTFAFSYKLTTLGDTSGWTLENVTDMYNTFNNCTKLIELDASNWGLGRLKSFSFTFYDCNALESLGDTGDWDLSNVEDMIRTFLRCYALQSLNGKNWNLGSLKYMEYTFQDNRSLTAIENADDWDLSNLENMIFTFQACPVLKTLHTTNWNTSNINRFDTVFGGDCELSDIDISKFRFDNATEVKHMFMACHKLSGTLNYNSNSANGYIFSNIKHENGEQIIINYTTTTESTVNVWLQTIYKGQANLVKGELIS